MAYVLYSMHVVSAEAAMLFVLRTVALGAANSSDPLAWMGFAFPWLCGSASPDALRLPFDVLSHLRSQHCLGEVSTVESFLCTAPKPPRTSARNGQTAGLSTAILGSIPFHDRRPDDSRPSACHDLHFQFGVLLFPAFDGRTC